MFQNVTNNLIPLMDPVLKCCSKSYELVPSTYNVQRKSFSGSK